jgi:hypothetical protein
MEPDKPPLPPWIPWAATACLAAAVACVGGLLAVERQKGRIQSEELALSRDALAAAQNQLMAERIVARREIADLAGKAGAVALMLPAGGGAPPPIGTATTLPGRRTVAVTVYGLPPQAADHDYQAWVDGGAGCSAASEAFHAGGAVAMRQLRIGLPADEPDGARFLLVDGRKGGFPSLPEALSSGSIVLASSAASPSISGR